MITTCYLRLAPVRARRHPDSRIDGARVVGVSQNKVSLAAGEVLVRLRLEVSPGVFDPLLVHATVEPSRALLAATVEEMV